MTPTVTKRSGIEESLSSIARDFGAIKIGFVKLVQLKKQEGFVQSTNIIKQRQLSYKEKFAKISLDKIDPRKKSLKEHTEGFMSMLKSIAGVLGGVFVVFGVAGIAKMILSSDTGKYLGKFLSTIFTALIDLGKSLISVVQSLFQDSEVKSSFYKVVSSLFKFVGDALMKGFEIFKTLITDSEIINTILQTTKNIFSAIFDSLGAITSIVADIFTSNTTAIKDGVIQFFTKIIDVIVPVLSIIAGSFSALAQSDKFKESIRNIGMNIWDLIVAMWNIDYTSNEGKANETRKSIAGEITGFLLETAVLYFAMMRFKVSMIELGAAVAAANFSKPGACDCGSIGPEDIEKPKPDETKRKRPGTEEKMRGQKTSRDRLDQMKKISEAGKETPKSQSWWQRAKSAAGETWDKLSSKAKNMLTSMQKGFEAAKNYIKTYAEKVARTARALVSSTKIKTKVMTAFTKRFGTAAAARLTAFFAAQGAAIAAAPATAGLSLVVDILLAGLAAYDIYSLYHLLFVSSDGENEDGGLIKDLQADIDAFEKQETGGVVQEPPSPTPSVAPVAPAAAVASTSPTTPAAAPKPATPSPKSASEVVAKQREAAGPTESTTPERTMAGYSYAATEALQAKMKKGDVSAEQHEAGTDILAQNLMGLVPGFNRFTAFDDSFHNKVSPGSKHASGLALDFTINGGSEEYKKAAAAVRKHFESVGLGASDVRVIDEMNNPSSKATGPHVHVQFQSKEASDKYRSLYPNVPLTAYAKDSAPSEGTPFTMPKPGQTEVAAKEEEKKSLASLMLADLSKSMATLDEMMGGKLGFASDEMNGAMRALEDEINKNGVNFFDNSINIGVVNSTNKIGNDTEAPKNDAKIFSSVLSRQYS